MFYFQGKIVQLGIENSDLDWDMESDGSYSNDVELGPWEREMVNPSSFPILLYVIPR